MLWGYDGMIAINGQEHTIRDRFGLQSRQLCRNNSGYIADADSKFWNIQITLNVKIRGSDLGSRSLGGRFADQSPNRRSAAIAARSRTARLGQQREAQLSGAHQADGEAWYREWSSGGHLFVAYCLICYLIRESRLSVTGRACVRWQVHLNCSVRYLLLQPGKDGKTQDKKHRSRNRGQGIYGVVLSRVTDGVLHVPQDE